MISFFRTIFDSWIGRLLAIGFIVLIGLAFALSDVSSTLGGGGAASSSATVAEVGDLDINARDYTLAVQTEHQRLRERNPNLDVATFIKQGGGEAILDRLIASFALAAFGDKYGMGASQAMVDSEIAKMPGARGLNGEFDSTAYNQFLSDRGLTDEVLRDDIHRTFLAEQLLAAASFGVQPPEKTVARYAEINFEKRSGKVVAFPSIIFAPKENPSDAELKRFYRDGEDRFTIPERRAVSYAFFTPDIVGDRANPTDEEIAAYYNANKDEFAASKIVKFRQLVLPTKEAAEQVVKRARSGESLDAIANELGFALTDGSAQSEKALAKDSNAAIARSIYAAGQGDVTDAAKGEFGYVVAHVTDIDQRPSRTLAEARGSIVELVATEKRAQTLATITDDIQDRFDDGESLSDVAKSYKLKVQTTPMILPNGAAPDNPSYKPSETVKPLLAEAFQMDSDEPARLIEAGQNRYALIAIKDVAEAAPPPLEKVREAVIAAWKIDKGEAAARKAGDKAIEKIRSGSSLSEAISSLSKQLPQPQTISGTRQEIAQQGEQVPPALFALFQIPRNGARLVPVGQERGFLLILVDDVTPAELAADDERLPQFKQQYRASLEQELQQQFVAAMRNDVGVEVKDDARDAVLRQLSGDS